ncbi:MAG: S41 family peptidase [bacterium]
MNKKYLLIIFLLVFVLGYYLGQTEKPIIKPAPQEKADMTLFWETWNLVEEKYVDQVNNQDLMYGAIKGMVSALKDPYSTFMTPEENKQFMEDMQGSFEGIGAEIGIRDNILTIIAPLEGMPAEKAGLKAGDKVIKVDDKSTAEMTLDQAVRLIRGPKNTDIILTVLRNGESKAIKITRSKIDIKSVKLEQKDNNIVYIDISGFLQDTSREFAIAAAQVLLSNPKGIILDLRNNPGGYLDQAVDVAGWFVDRGEVIAIEDFGNGEQTEHKAFGNARLKNYPIVILVNQGSASGSEILAGALRDLRGVKLIGEKTFGKGSVQELENLENKSSLRITVAKWLTPDGYCIHEKGLEPDIAVLDDPKTEDIDEQLEEAMVILR